MREMCVIRVYACITFLFYAPFVASNNKIQDERLCVDPKCAEPISHAKSEIKYNSYMDGVLSFEAGQLMTIYSKTTPEDSKLKRGYWGAEIDGKRGYVPPNLVRETRVLRRDVHTVVPTQENKKEVIVEPSQNEVVTQTVSGGVAAELGDGGPPTTPFTVVEGTTMYFGLDGEKVIEPSATQDPSLKTETVDANTSGKKPSVDISTETAENEIEGASEADAGNEKTDSSENDEDDDEGDDNDEDEEEEQEESEEDADTKEALLSVLKHELDLEINKEPAKSTEVVANTVENSQEKEAEQIEVETLVGSSKSLEQAAPEEETANINAHAPTTEVHPHADETTPLTSSETPSSSSSEPTPSSSFEPTPLPSSEATPLPPLGTIPSSPPVEVPLSQIPSSNDAVIAETGASQLPPDTLTEGTAESSQNSVPVEEAVTLKPEDSAHQSLVANVLAVDSPEKPVQSIQEELSSDSLQPSATEPAVTTEQTEKEVQDRPVRPPTLGALPPMYPGLFPPQPQVPLQEPTVAAPHAASDATPQLVPNPSHIPEETSLLPLGNGLLNTTFTPEEEVILQPVDSYSTISEEAPADVHSAYQESTPIPNDSSDLSEVESEGFLSGISGMFSDLFGSDTAKEQVPDEPAVPLVDQSLEPPVADIFLPGEVHKVVPEGQCKSIEGLETDCDDAPSPSYLFEFLDRKTSGTTYTFVYLVVTAVTVLAFTLGHYFIERNRQDGPLIAKVNQLTRELQVATAQLESRSFKESSSLAEINSEVLVALQAEVDDLKRIKSEQEAQLEAQQQELEGATEAGLELNRMLSDLLGQDHGSDNLLLSVEQLQSQLDSQQKIIDDMNRSLIEKNAENDTLQSELATAQEKIENLDEELIEMRQNLNMHLKEKEEVTQLLEDQNAKLQADLAAAVKNKATEVTALTKSVAELTEKLAVRDSEFSALSDAIEQLQTKDVDTKVLYDVGHVKAELLRVQAERDALQERLSDEEGARSLLEDHVKAVDEEVTRLRASCDTAEKDKLEAETRLTVLSNYFKEKETQLQKELGLQEAMWVQKKGDDTTVYQRIKSLQEEVENYKSQNEILKKEILDQERGLKGQIATLEKKAHENWVAARQAERRLEESKQEAGQLRNMLTLMEKSQVSEVDSKAPGRLPGELNGDDPLPPLLGDGTSPLPFPPPLTLDPMAPPPMLPPGFMPPPFMHPPPSGFIPPPPFLMGDRRPAPLGRMSSPPLNRFSPGPGGCDDYDRLSPPLLSPPIRNYRSPPAEGDRFRHRPPSPPFPSRPWDDPPLRAGFRPVANQRDSRRDYQDSNLSSGHSSNDSLDKPSRMKV